jgi:hypothetical protein
MGAASTATTILLYGADEATCVLVQGIEKHVQRARLAQIRGLGRKEVEHFLGISREELQQEAIWGLCNDAVWGQCGPRKVARVRGNDHSCAAAYGRRRHMPILGVISQLLG